MPLLSATASSSDGPFAARFTLPAPPAWTGRALAGIWMTWVLWWSVRIAAAMLALRRARRNVRPFPAEHEARLANWMAVRATSRPARLVESSDVAFAAVLGGRVPVIAVSPAVVAAVDDRDLDRLVVHEWAHVQRYDDVGRPLQLVVRALAGFHPAVWWLERQIHIDRETACDDWTVNLTGSARSYAAGLTRLAALQPGAGEQVLLPAALSTPELTRRVVRLLDGRRTTSTRRFGPVAAVMTAAVVAVAASIAGVRLVAVGTDVPLDAPVTRAAVQSVSMAAPVEAARPTADAERNTAPRLAQPPTPAIRTPDAREREVAPGVQSQPPVGQSLPPTPIAPPAIAAAGEPRSPDVSTARELPGTQAPVPRTGVDRAAAPPASGESAAKSPWGAAADAGVSVADAGVNVGRGSQKAAVATAGFFSRLGKSIARSF
jgi:beta-lactamase regulating signal transducer with metallopeptidase domain